MEENGATILGASVRALAVGGRWVMHLIEEFQELAVCDFLWVVDYLESLGVSCPPSAYGPIARVLGVATNVSNSRIQQALIIECLSVHVLDTPKAACSDCSLLSAGG